MRENERLRVELQRLHEVADQHHAWGLGIMESRRYKLGAALARPFDAVRGRLRAGS